MFRHPLNRTYRFPTFIGKSGTGDSPHFWTAVNPAYNSSFTSVFKEAKACWKSQFNDGEDYVPPKDFPEDDSDELYETEEPLLPPIRNKGKEEEEEEEPPKKRKTSSSSKRESKKPKK
jgi:hypothetical protein